MKKWLIFGLIGLLVAIGLVVLLIFLPGAQPQQATVPVTTLPATTAATTAPTEATEPPTEPTFDPSFLTARHCFVYDPDADELLYTLGDQEERISPASLTKLMTAYVAMQWLDPKAIIAVGAEAKLIELDSSIAAISQGTVVKVEMILQGMLMQSGNDAAYVLATAAGRAMACNPNLEATAAIALFMEEVNRQMRGNGILNTHFVTPDGYDADGHYSTPEDLLKITKLAMTNPLILRYCSVGEANVTYESGENYTWKNTNFLLREDMEEFYNPYATGLKTGTTSLAGACVIATFDDGQRRLIVGALGCASNEDRFRDADILYYFFQ